MTDDWIVGLLVGIFTQGMLIIGYLRKIERNTRNQA